MAENNGNGEDSDGSRPDYEGIFGPDGEAYALVVVVAVVVALKYATNGDPASVGTPMEIYA